MLKKPEVSVIMTIYNHESYLKDSIKSLQKQTFKNWELIAIENGSSDKSKKILKSFKDNRIKKKFLKKNIGRTKCLNLALKYVRGRYIAVLDSDDLALKNRLHEQVKHLKKNKNTYLLATNYFLFNDKKKDIKINSFKEFNNKKTILFRNCIAHSTVMYRKELINKVGIYPNNYTYAQDYAFYLKIFRKYKIDILKKFLNKIRYNHKESETIRNEKSNLIINEELKILGWVLKNFKFNIIDVIFIFRAFLKIFFKKFTLIFKNI